MTQTLEKSPSTSPLLGDAVIERDYTQGIETQLGEPKQQQQREQSPPPPPPGEKQQSQEQSQPGSQPQGEFDFDQPGDFEPPKGFQFEEEQEDPSDVGEGDQQEGFQLDSMSAKSLANTVGDIIKIKVPEITHQYVKVDLTDIKNHIAKGNIHPRMYEVYENVNEQILKDLAFSDDEIKMWKKAFAAYLEYKNIRTANPETAFYLATATLAITHLIKARSIKKSVTKLVYDGISSYNPSFFESYEAKQAEQETEKTEPKSKKTEKAEV